MLLICLMRYCTIYICFIKTNKTCLRSQLSDSNLEHLMKVAIEGPPLKDVDYNAIMDIFKLKKGALNFNLNNHKNKNIWKILGGEDIPELPPVRILDYL